MIGPSRRFHSLEGGRIEVHALDHAKKNLGEEERENEGETGDGKVTRLGGNKREKKEGVLSRDSVQTGVFILPAHCRASLIVMCGEFALVQFTRPSRLRELPQGCSRERSGSPTIQAQTLAKEEREVSMGVD